VVAEESAPPEWTPQLELRWVWLSCRLIRLSLRMVEDWEELVYYSGAYQRNFLFMGLGSRLILRTGEDMARI